MPTATAEVTRTINIETASRMIGRSGQGTIDLINRGQIKASRAPGPYQVDVDSVLQFIAQERKPKPSEDARPIQGAL
jgi:hypothetical protein